MAYEIDPAFSVALAPLNDVPGPIKTITPYGRTNPTMHAVDRMRVAAGMIAWMNENITATLDRAERTGQA